MIKQLTENDIEKILYLENKCFFDAWTEKMLLSELEKENSFFFGKFLQNKLTGYILLNTCVDEAEILKICVDDLHRKKGIGKELIDYAICNLKNINLINLEVRKSNTPAINLYLKTGFCIVGERKKYYKNNEDAVLMTKTL
jgi:ribosomal-protein-alanine N-acetyltransferase